MSDDFNIEKTAFLNELEKIALVTSLNVRSGTPIHGKLEEFIDRLEPGDILLTKGSLGRKGLISKLIEPFQEMRGVKRTSAPWTHSGIYVGNGKIRHSYLPIIGRGLGTKHKVRDHNLRALTLVGRDVLALRPKVSRKERREAVDRTKELLDQEYSWKALLRAGLYPAKRTRKEEIRIPESIICSTVVGAGYPQFSYKGKSLLHIMPADFADHRKMKSVAAFSNDKRYKDLPDSMKMLQDAINVD